MKRLFATLMATVLLAGCAAQSTAGGSAAATPAPTGGAAPALPGQQTAAPEATAEPVAEDWIPQQKITLIVAYKEGSGTDQGARLLAQYAGQAIGQTIEVKNIAANAGMAGWEELAQATPDGYTLGVMNMPNIFTAMDNGGNFTTHSFAPICSHVVETSVVVVPENSPYQTLEELLQANQAASESGLLLRAATNGVQASNDIGAALLAYTSGGWQFRHVSYGTTGDAIAALLAGECDWGVAKVSDVLPYLAEDDPALSGEVTAETNLDDLALVALVEAEDAAAPDADAETAAAPETDEIDADALPEADQDGHVALEASEHLRVLGVFGTVRAPELPGVATLNEQGYPTGWYGSTRAIVAPAGTDPVIIDYYAEVFRQVLEDPDCVQAHTDAGLSIFYLDPAALADRIDERERFSHTLVPLLFA